MVLLNGIMIRSINHPICKRLCLTYSPTGTRPDWPTIIGHAQRERYTLPHLVIRGPSVPAELSAYTARAGNGNQLNAILTGQAMLRGDLAIPPLPLSRERLTDQYMLRRAGARALTPNTDIEAALTHAFHESSSRAIRAKDDTRNMDMNSGYDLMAQLDMGVKMLSSGVSRCVTMADIGEWDSHMDNSPQSRMFDSMFTALYSLMLKLDTTPGTVAPTLAEETVVVVMSEMGRTPFYNSTGGKDHWPYTSFMLIGDGLAPNRAVGSWDPYLNGVTINPVSGLPDSKGVTLEADMIGSTLLALADIDPAQYLDEDRAIRELLV
jgi:hypothetical protein